MPDSNRVSVSCESKHTHHQESETFIYLVVQIIFTLPSRLAAVVNSK